MKLIAFIGVTFLMFGCSLDTFYIKENENISTTDRTEITQIVDSIYSNLISNRREYLYSIADGDLKINMSRFDSNMKNLSFLAAQQLKPMDEFMIKNTTRLSIDSVSFREKEYVFRFKPALLTYIYLLPVTLKDSKVVCLLSFVFHKVDNTWLIADISIGDGYYSIKALTAKDYFKRTKKSYESGNLPSAFFNSQFAMNCLLPAGSHFHYKIEKDIYQQFDDVSKELVEKKTFPLKFRDINGDPEVLNIATKSIDGSVHKAGLYSYVYCQSKVSVTDTQKITKMVYALNEKIAKEVPEINNVNDSIGYRFYNYSDTEHALNDPHLSIYLPVYNGE